MIESKGKRKKEKLEGVESHPLRTISLLQALQAEWLNLLTIQCQASTQTAQDLTALIPKCGHATQQAERCVFGPLYQLSPGLFLQPSDTLHCYFRLVRCCASSLCCCRRLQLGAPGGAANAGGC